MAVRPPTKAHNGTQSEADIVMVSLFDGFTHRAACMCSRVHAILAARSILHPRAVPDQSTSRDANPAVLHACMWVVLTRPVIYGRPAENPALPLQLRSLSLAAVSPGNVIREGIAIGAGAQSTLGGTTLFARKICMKINKIPDFYIIIARKIFSPNFRGHVPPCPPSPTPIGIANVAGLVE